MKRLHIVVLLLGSAVLTNLFALVYLARSISQSLDAIERILSRSIRRGRTCRAYCACNKLRLVVTLFTTRLPPCVCYDMTLVDGFGDLNVFSIQ